MAPRTKKAAADSENGEDDVSTGGTIILLNSLGTYGMKMTKERKQFQLLQRKLYEERTEIPNPFAKPGEPEFKVYEAGEYGPWTAAPRPFPCGKDAIQSALQWVRNWTAMDEINNSKQDVMNLDAALEYFEAAKVDLQEVAVKMERAL